jgi:hypothetical protein
VSLDHCFDEIEGELEIHIGAVAVFDLVSDDAVIAHQAGLPIARGSLTVFAEDLLAQVSQSLTQSDFLCLNWAFFGGKMT